MRTPPHMNVSQHGRAPFQVFAVEDAFRTDELTYLDGRADDVLGAHFTRAAFANGKTFDPDLSEYMYDRMRSSLPATYQDEGGTTWHLRGCSRMVMAGHFESGQQFGLHTDTGCNFENSRHRSKFTVLVCVRDRDLRGGETEFYDLEYRPLAKVEHAAGRALVFDIDLPHRGCALDAGEKRWIGNEIVYEAVAPADRA